MYDPIEIIGRYVLTGIILWAALIIMATIRLAWVAFKPEYGGGFEFIDRFTSSNRSSKKSHTGKKGRILVAIIRLILWPYGIIRGVHIYMQTEIEAINKTIEFNERKGS